MATKSNGGWVILVAALAVPGFLFFQWYSKLDAQKKAEIERHVRRNLPKDAPIFGSAPGGEKLSNPIAQSAGLPAGAPVVGSLAATTPVAGAVGAAAANAAVAAANATAAAQPGAVPGQHPFAAASPAAPAIPGALPAAAAIPASAVPAGIVPPAAAATTPAAAVPGAAPAAVAGVTSAATPLAGAAGFSASADPSSPFGSMIQTGAITQIVLARDPMLSPFDMVRIAEDELRKRRAQEEMEAEVKHREIKKHYKAPEKSGDTLVDLQGIVSAGDQDKAIVNGEMVGEGDMIAGVKVVKITPTGVVFTYHNKRFVKSVSK